MKCTHTYACWAIQRKNCIAQVAMFTVFFVQCTHYIGMGLLYTRSGYTIHGRNTSIMRAQEGTFIFPLLRLVWICERAVIIPEGKKEAMALRWIMRLEKRSWWWCFCLLVMLCSVRSCVLASTTFFLPCLHLLTIEGAIFCSSENIVYGGIIVLFCKLFETENRQEFEANMIAKSQKIIENVLNTLLKTNNLFNRLFAWYNSF